MRRRLFPALLALTAAPATSHAVGLATQLNCASDYYAYCSQHPVGSPGVRKCMRENGPRLSKSCISALISDGEISKAEVERTKAKLASDKAQARQKTKAKIEEAKAKTKTKADKPVEAVAERKAPAKTKREAVAKLTDDDTRKVSKPQVAPAPKVQPEPSERATTKPELPAPKPAASQVEPVLTLDEETYKALKAREAYFVVEEDDVTPVVRAASDSAGTDASNATSPADEDAAAQSQNANPPVLPEKEAKPASNIITRSVTVEKDTSPVGTAVAEPPAETAEPDTAKSASDPAPRESASRKTQAAKKPDYPPGKMALGRPSTQPSVPAVKPVPSQSQAWQEFMNNRFSGGFNYEGMDASFSRRGR
ncbi:MAG: hypothetical protein AB7S74_13720 [Hyphomicrobium sp.]